MPSIQGNIYQYRIDCAIACVCLFGICNRWCTIHIIIFNCCIWWCWIGTFVCIWRDFVDVEWRKRIRNEFLWKCHTHRHTDSCVTSIFYFLLPFIVSPFVEDDDGITTAIGFFFIDKFSGSLYSIFIINSYFLISVLDHCFTFVSFYLFVVVGCTTNSFFFSSSFSFCT